MKTVLIYYSIRINKAVKQFNIGVKLVLIIFMIISNVKVSATSFILVNNFSTVISDNYYLKMHGSVKKAKDWEGGILRKLDSAKVVVLNSENHVVVVLYTNSAGMCSINLPLNEQFIIKVSRRGWVTKIIDVDTRLNGKKPDRYYLNFEVDMFEDIKGLDASILNSAIANVAYDRFKNRFDYNYKYTDEINEKLRRLYSNYYRLRRQNYLDRVITDNESRNLRNQTLSNNKTNTKTNADKKQALINKKNRQSEYLQQADSLTQNLEKTSLINKVRSTKSTLFRDKNKHDIVFRIQILALDGYLPLNATFFKKCGKARESIHNGKYIYTLGEFRNYEAVLRMVNVVKSVGYHDAFPVAFLNEHRLTVTEAHAMQNASK